MHASLVLSQYSHLEYYDWEKFKYVINCEQINASKLAKITWVLGVFLIIKTILKIENITPIYNAWLGFLYIYILYLFILFLF